MQGFVAVKLPGYRTIGATSIASAEQQLAAIGPKRLSLVCVDHVLEGPQGLDFLESVNARYPAVPAILFTGRANESDVQRARTVGIRVLWKPATLSAWLQVISALLSGKT